jgi:DNA (cytosine-5)-methyltransferase 1
MRAHRHDKILRAQRPVAIELFSGAGGMSLGFEQAGFDVLAAAEYDPIHAAVHSYNFPSTTMVCADVSSLTATSMREAAAAGWAAHGHADEWDGHIDVVIGGPPCQGFSLIGKRASDDPRNWLVFHFARLVAELKPAYFVMENVPGMAHASAEKESLVDALVAVFTSSGYSVGAPLLLNARDFGVPQDRRRLFLIGARKGKKPVSAPETMTATGPTVSDAIGDLPDLDGFPELKNSDCVHLCDTRLDSMRSAMSPYARILHGLDQDPDDYSQRRIWDAARLTSSCRTTHRADVVERFAKTPPGRPEPISRLRRLDAASVSSTLRAGTHYERGSFNAPRPIHPTLPRVISVREGARLHSFPDWFRLHWTKWHGFRQLGNSLPPRLGRAVGAEVMRALERRPERPRRSIKLSDEALLTMENLSAAAHFDADVTQIPRNALRQRPKSAEPATAVV